MKRTVADYIKLFRKARDFDKERFAAYKELTAFYEGQQNLLTEYQLEKPWVIDLNTPYSADAIDLRVASLQANDYVGELEPLSPLDVDKIDILNSVMKNQWNEMQMDDLVNESINRSLVTREAYVHIIYNDTEVVGGTNTLRDGKFSGYFIDPASILIDPNTLKFKKADYIVVTERISKRQALEEYEGKITEMDLQGIGSVLTPEDRGEIYTGTDYNTEQQDVLSKLTFYIKEKKGMIKSVLIENIIVEEEDFTLNKFPIAQLRCYKKFKSPYGLSLMDRLLPLQKSVNSIESAIVNVALQFAFPTIVVSATSGIDAEELAQVIGAPGLIIGVQGDPKTAVSVLFSNILNKDMIDVKKENENTIYKIAGTTEEFLGNLGTSGNTTGGSDIAVTRSKIIEQKFLSNLEEFIQDLTEILVTFIIQEFSGKTIYSRGEKQTDGKFPFTSTELPEGLEDLNYTFAINLDIKTPYSKEKTKRLLQELFQFEMQYDAPVKTLTVLDIIKVYDLPNKQELVERYKDLTQKDNQTKAQVIIQWTTIAEKHGIDANIITQGIVEIIAGKETPTVDQVIMQIQQQMQQQMQQQQQNEQRQLEERTRLAEDQLKAQFKQNTQPMKGDETFETGEQQPVVTGDETLNIQQ